MADGGQAALQPPPAAPPAVPPAHPVQIPAHPCTGSSPTCTTSCPISSMKPYTTIKTSHFKPEFVGRPDEDAEALLLRTNDWMDTHVFPEGVKVHRFCLTLVGKAR